MNTVENQLLTMQGLVDAVTQQESSGRPMVEHPRSGAVGLMQIIPSQASQGMRGDMLGLFDIAAQEGFDVSDRSEEASRALLMDPVVNQRFGQEYLQSLLTKYNGNIDAALTAYNAGPGRYDQVIADGGSISNMPEQEQRDYARAVREEFFNMYGFDMPQRAVLQSPVPTPRPGLLAQ